MKKSPESLVRRTVWPTSVSTPVVTPLQMSVVYASPDPDSLDAQYADASGFTYSREGHPNAQVLAQKIDYLEGATNGIITGSGMSAIGAVFLGLLKAGDHVLGGDQLYGRSLRLMTQDLPRLGIETSLADPTDLAAMRAAVRPETAMILVEVMSNPTIRIADMEGITALAREVGALLVVDNTFTTPRLYRPLDHGADIVVHSVTKLLGGHADAMLGYVASRDPELRTKINDANVTWGMTPSPFDCSAAGPGRTDGGAAGRCAGGLRQRQPGAVSDPARPPRPQPGGGPVERARRQYAVVRTQRRAGGGQCNDPRGAADRLCPDAGRCGNDVVASRIQQPPRPDARGASSPRDQRGVFPGVGRNRRPRAADRRNATRCRRVSLDRGTGSRNPAWGRSCALPIRSGRGSEGHRSPRDIDPES